MLGVLPGRPRPTTGDEGPLDREDVGVSNGHAHGILGSALPEPLPTPLTPGRHRIGQAVVLLPPAPIGTLVFLHGAGGDALDSERRIAEPAVEAGLLTICPTSVGSTWDLIAGGSGPDVAEIDRLLVTVRAAAGLDGTPLLLGGFSDGASYALSIGLANGGLVDAIVAFSPGFALPPRTRGAPAVFISHGHADRVLPVACSHRIVAALTERGTPPTYVEFRGGHEIPGDVLEQAFRWARAVGRDT